MSIWRKFKENVYYQYFKQLGKKAKCHILEENKEFKMLTLAMDEHGALKVSVAVDCGDIGHRLESVIIFDKDIFSAKTLSDISDICYKHKISVSGIENAGNERLKFHICYYLGHSVSWSDFKYGISYILQGMAQLVQYIYQRSEKNHAPKIDLSMFEDIELFLFNPRKIGEEKEFLYETWDNYIEKVAEKVEESPGDSFFCPTIEELLACQAFEEVNDLKVAELGDVLLEELLMNRRMSEGAAMEDYSIQ